MPRRDYAGIYFIPSPARTLEESTKTSKAIDNSIKTIFTRKDYDWVDYKTWFMRNRVLQTTTLHPSQSEGQPGQPAQPPSYQHIFQLRYSDQDDQEIEENQVNPERAYCCIQKPSSQKDPTHKASVSQGTDAPYTPGAIVEVPADSAENHINFLELTGLWSFRRAFEVQDGQLCSLIRMYDPDKGCDTGTFHMRVGIVTASRERRFGGELRWDTRSPGVILEITYKNVNADSETHNNVVDDEEYTQALVADAQEHIRGLWQRLQSGLDLPQSSNLDIKEVMMGPEPLRHSSVGGGEAQSPAAIVRMWCELLRRL
ncbi:uncharacterized protein EI97DRAFT_457041 [Westerdykella ornata]|uniref:Uncharacterized protein n=1 Tax=Westerdykella ornata TaxID=318751 RepID=A0A6A6JPG3_WESOR|nr:uncharacterized protein EI97DRAFT_457041 [Westerdykella ornata]KAF2277798.1 hypothetical protein EI97DRAFT_457041 [Westerdykella ornata]